MGCGGPRGLSSMPRAGWRAGARGAEEPGHRADRTVRVRTLLVSRAFARCACRAPRPQALCAALDPMRCTRSERRGHSLGAAVHSPTSRRGRPKLLRRGGGRARLSPGPARRASDRVRPAGPTPACKLESALRGMGAGGRAGPWRSGQAKLSRDRACRSARKNTDSLRALEARVRVSAPRAPGPSPPGPTFLPQSSSLPSFPRLPHPFATPHPPPHTPPPPRSPAEVWPLWEAVRGLRGGAGGVRERKAGRRAWEGGGRTRDARNGDGSGFVAGAAARLATPLSARRAERIAPRRWVRAALAAPCFREQYAPPGPRNRANRANREPEHGAARSQGLGSAASVRSGS